ncbi:MAG: hypothetical protein DRR19_22140 [Candidatus Parabeggiatoa sp. nov. 1]|nr:MAG: hypothetical protein DRR19_22140 [Gammaproteobacteria bacterium]
MHKKQIPKNQLPITRNKVELRTRCIVVQSSLENFLTCKHKTLVAIVMANLLFATVHVYLSLAGAALVFAHMGKLVKFLFAPFINQ